MALAGGTSLLLAGGVGSSDPERRYPPNHCLGIYNFPPQGAGPESAGVAFYVPTTGHDGVRVGFDVYPDALSSRWVRLQWTRDGVMSWKSGTAGNGSDGTGLYDLKAAAWYQLEADLTLEEDMNDAALFGFRLVSTFAPGESIYEACGSSSPYSRFGLMFVDMVTVQARKKG